MMKIPAATVLFLMAALGSRGQVPVGSWSDHLSYNTAVSLAVASKKIFASTGSSLEVYDKVYSELKKVSRTEGLSETGISDISWSEENGILVIGYTSTNLDLYSTESVFNMPDILNSYIPGRKAINRIRCNGRYAYIACSFGIVVADLVKKEIHDTWRPADGADNNEVSDITFGNDRIFAATETGIFYAGINDDGLSYFGNWTRLNTLPDPGAAYNALVYSGNRLYSNRTDPSAAGDSLFVSGSSTTLFSYQQGIFNHSIEPGSEGFTVASGSSARYFSSDGTLQKTINGYGSWHPDINQAVEDNGNIWIADINTGLIRVESPNQFQVLTLPGPASNDVFNIVSRNGMTILSAGGTDNSWNGLKRPYEVSLYSENSWTHLSDATLADPVRALIDPMDEGHFFIATWGTGLIEYRDFNPVRKYDDSNSPLQSIIPGQPYVRICGLAMDKQQNLWITQSGVPGSVKMLSPDGKWTIIPVTVDAPVAGDLVITRAGHKWIILPGGYGLFIFDDNKTPGSFTDDRSKRLIVRDAGDQIISSVFSIAEDLQGNIWIGTNDGPLVYYSPQNVFTEDLIANRIKIPRNDGSGLADYLLKSVSVTAVSVDGSDRKWLGTAGSGAYYVSQDGVSQLKHFNKQNSPILSDSVITIAVDNKTGEVWFGTSRGTQSYRGNATEGSTGFNKVYAFPNPVRENFTGNLTITGLMENTQINITDISGNLVYRTVSDGGQATWDLKTYNGRRVSTGVYLIFCASSDGSQSYVTKVLVIR